LKGNTHIPSVLAVATAMIKTGAATMAVVKSTSKGNSTFVKWGRDTMRDFAVKTIHLRR